jgi:hypothetical protein
MVGQVVPMNLATCIAIRESQARWATGQGRALYLLLAIPRVHPPHVRIALQDFEPR